MTEVPGSEWYKLDDAASDAIPKPHFPMEGDWQNCGNIEHVFTHFALTLTVWKLNSDEAPTQMGWWSKKENLNSEALPTAFKKVLARMFEN